MDRIDLKILELLQKNAMLSSSEIADKVGLSKTPCWRRIQQLEQSGVLKKRVALLDRDALNKNVDVFVTIRTNQHNAEWFEKLKSVVNTFPEVVEFYRMSGDIDYLMRVVVTDINEYDRFYQRLIEKIDISDVNSNFAMEQLKYTTAIPL